MAGSPPPKRVPDAFRLVKSLSKAETLFHQKLRSILRKRSERSDKLFDVFRNARDYKPELVAEVLGDTYTPHNAAMLMKLLKRQVLASLRIYMEGQDDVLKELAEQGIRRVESQRLGKKTTPHSTKKHKSQIAPSEPAGKRAETKTLRPVDVVNVVHREYERADDVPAEERKKQKKQEKWLEWIQKDKPEKALKKWKELKKAGLADEANEKLLHEALERRVKSLAESGKTGEAVELIYRAEKRGFRINGAREIMRAWLSENHPS